MDANIMDIKTSLICAVREGRLEITRELINSYGLSYSRAWSQGYVLLRHAVENKHTAVAELLLTSGAKVNCKTKNPSNTPLHLSCKNGDIEIVKMLLDKGADVNVENERGRTPLHNAIEDMILEVAEIIMNQRYDVNPRDNDVTNNLHVAVDIKCSQIVEHLLNSGADVNCICTETLKKGYTPLHFAVEAGSKEVVELLLNRGANVEVKGENGKTPLHIAIQAYNKNKRKIMNLLLQHGAKVDNQDKDGKTALQLAVEKECPTIVEDVLRYCPEINNKGNRSSLKFAVYGIGEEHEEIVEALLEYGISVDPEDANDPKLLLTAVMKGYLKIIEDLLKYGADVNAISGDFTSFSDELSTYRPLHVAAEYKQEEIAKLLISYGADINAISGDFTSFSDELSTYRPLHVAAEYKQEEIAKLLISYGADINAQDKSGNVPIFYAVENADIEMTNLLLTHGASITHCPAVLNKAVDKECIEIIEAILQHGADINASDEYGRTALHWTTSRSKFTDDCLNIKGEIAELLLSRGARVDAETRNGETTLHAATKKGYVKVVEVLLKYNANVNSRGETSGITPLHLSADGGNEEICAMLLNKGAHVNATQKDGTTALHIAVQYGREKVVKILLEHGANVDSKMLTGSTALHLGAEKGYTEIIENILKFGANIDSTDDHGLTALHIAIRNKHEKVVVTLLDYGSDINITTLRNETPFDLADHHFADACEALKRQIVQMKTANLYLSEQNLQSMSRSDEISGFQNECKEEIARMKQEKINCQNISFYDILAKSTSSLAIFMRNEYIVWALQLGQYKNLFPIYASMINSHFRKAMERKASLDQGKKKFEFLFEKFPKLPNDCTEKILSYLSKEDLTN